MNAVSNSTINSASNASLDTAQGIASVAVMKKDLNATAANTAALLASVAQPKLATSGTLGTQLNTVA